MGLTEILTASTLSLLSACASQKNKPQEPVPKEVLAEFAEAWKICDLHYIKERRQEGETPRDFGKRFCAKYGLGQYINPCGGDFYHISCLENNECMVLIGDKMYDPSTDYCGKCD